MYIMLEYMFGLFVSNIVLVLYNFFDCNSFLYFLFCFSDSGFFSWLLRNFFDFVKLLLGFLISLEFDMFELVVNVDDFKVDEKLKDFDKCWGKL